MPMPAVFCILAVTLLEILSQYPSQGQIPTVGGAQPSFVVSGSYPDYYQYLMSYLLATLSNGSSQTPGSLSSFPAAGLPAGMFPTLPLSSGQPISSLIPGISGLPPSVSGLPPGVSGLPPGVSGLPPGVSGLPPGVSGLPPGVSGLPPVVSGLLPTGVSLPSTGVPNTGGITTIPGTNISIAGVPTGVQVYDPTQFYGYPYVYGSPGLENSPFASIQGYFGPPCTVGIGVGHCLNPSAANNLVGQLCSLLGNQLAQGTCASGTTCCYTSKFGQPEVNPSTPPVGPTTAPTITDTCVISNSNRGFCIEDTTRGQEYCNRLSFKQSPSTCSSGFFCCYGQSPNEGNNPTDMPTQNNVCGFKGNGMMGSMGNTGSNYGPQSFSPPSYSPPSNPSYPSSPTNNYSPPSSISNNYGSPIGPSNPPSTYSQTSSGSLPPSSPSSGSLGSPWQGLRRRRRDAYSNNPSTNAYSNAPSTNPYSYNYGTQGGTPAGEGEYCWQAAIYINGKFKCSGSLIRSQWVLTSAYCVFGQDPYNIRVRIGQANLNGDTSNSQTKAIEDIYVNFNYDPDSPGYENNIALVHLKVPVVLDTVCLVCLPGIPSTYVVDQRCVVTGYGSNALGQNGASFLRQVTQTVVNDQVCTRTVSNVVRNFVYDPSYLCAGGASGADSCLADGGSPLVCQGDDGSYSQYGIASWSIGCGVNGIPTIYTDVYRFIDWINSAIALVEKDPAIPRQSEKDSRLFKSSKD